MARPRPSQAIWTEGEALERRGDKAGAVKLFVKAAIAEEDALEPLRARVLWEQVAARTGPTPMLLERLAAASDKARFPDDALAYWLAAEALALHLGQKDVAERAAAALAASKARALPATRPALVTQVLDRHAALVSGRLARFGA